ncbi:MAG TPA: glycosyltransferase [Nitrospirae bacterium]|nr:glycosyltransferase [Nitrospirota bacterium]
MGALKVCKQSTNNLNMVSRETRKIDIIIPAFNAAGHIEECLDHIYASDYDNFQVTVVDDCSTDETLNKVKAYPLVRVLKNPVNKGVSAARNHGINETDGDIVVFIDSDVLIPKQLLSQMLNSFERNPEVSIIQGRYDDTSYYKNTFSQYKHFIFSFRGLNPMDDGKYANYVHTACVAVLREVVEEVRFNEDLTRGEDVDFGQRCAQKGFLIYVDRELTVRHKKKYTFASFTRYQFNSAKEMASQFLAGKSDRKEQPFYSSKNPLYKKLWILRPFVSWLFLLSLSWGLFGGGLFPRLLLASSVVASFLFEYNFRLYLLRVAPLKVNLAAVMIYFYDGLITSIGIAAAVTTNMIGNRINTRNH